MKPILFNTEMVRAILAGRKTVTRRVVKPQPTYSPNYGFSWKGAAYGTDLPPTIRGAAYNFRIASPYRPGDILYVREVWVFDTGGPEDEIGTGCFAYKADGEKSPTGRWYSSIHMPKEAARLFLRVTDVRVERLQDIDDEDVVSEGMKIGDPFDNLWNSTIKKADLPRYGWEANPWVWAIEFERVSRKVGQNKAKAR